MEAKKSPRKERAKQRHRLWYQRNKGALKDAKVRFHFKMEVKKKDEERLDRIRDSLDTVKKSLRNPSNADIMDQLLHCWYTSRGSSSTVIPTPMQTLPDADSFNASLGTDQVVPEELLVEKKQLHSECQENDEIYLVCGSALNRIFKFFICENEAKCHCGQAMDFTTFEAARVTKNNHCAKVKVECIQGHTLEWFSSSIMSSPSAGKYYVNAR